jgi:hypothetical protein
MTKEHAPRDGTKPPPKAHVVFGEPEAPPDELTALLQHLQRVMMLHPAASQALYRAFVQEGRQFAETPEGEQWLRRLQKSDAVHRGLVAWDVLTLRAFEDDDETVLPTAILDAFVRVTAERGLEPFLSQVAENGPLSELF